MKQQNPKNHFEKGEKVLCVLESKQLGIQYGKIYTVLETKTEGAYQYLKLQGAKVKTCSYSSGRFIPALPEFLAEQPEYKDNVIFAADRFARGRSK